MQSRDLIDAWACVYRDLDARSRHTKSTRKIASYVLINLNAVKTDGLNSYSVMNLLIMKRSYMKYIHTDCGEEMIVATVLIEHYSDWV